LIFVPLVAVPLLAVVGMPQLPSSASTPAGDDLKFVQEEPGQPGTAGLLEPVRVSDSKTDSRPKRRELRSTANPTDPFAEFTRDADGSRRSATSANSGRLSQKRPQRWQSEGNGLPQKALLSISDTVDDHAAGEPSDRPTASGSGDDQSTASPDNEASAKLAAARRDLPEAEAVVALDSESSETRAASDVRSPKGGPLSWKRAVGRLNALGIRDFQLQPGARDGEFNFSCRFASQNNPRLIHRFEAESADPLEAVNQVLQQLDDWKTRRAQRSEAARTPANDQRQTTRAADAAEVEVTNRDF
jgi:hypothetical protein